MRLKSFVIAAILALFVILVFELLTPFILKAEQSGNKCSAVMCATPDGIKVRCVDFYNGAFLCVCKDC